MAGSSAQLREFERLCKQQEYQWQYLSPHASNTKVNDAYSTCATFVAVLVRFGVMYSDHRQKSLKGGSAGKYRRSVVEKIWVHVVREKTRDTAARPSRPIGAKGRGVKDANMQKSNLS